MLEKVSETNLPFQGITAVSSLFKQKFKKLLALVDIKTRPTTAQLSTSLKSLAEHGSKLSGANLNGALVLCNLLYRAALTSGGAMTGAYILCKDQKVRP